MNTPKKANKAKNQKNDKNNIASMIHEASKKRHAKAISEGLLDMCRHYGLDPSSIRR